MSLTTYQKSRRIEVTPMLNTKTRLQKSLQVCVNYNVRKAFLFVRETLFLHFKTFHKVSLRPVTTAKAVEHILTGKAIARAVRAHRLVDAAVNTLTVSKALKVPIPGLRDKSDDPPSVEDESHDHEADVSPNARPSEDGRQNCDLQEARSLFDELMNKRKSAEEVSAADVLTRIDGLLQEQRDLMNDNRIALLWLQYLEMVHILRMFIKAERTGNWRLHFQALPEMLPYLAAAGHNLYTKSVQLYLESISSLGTDHPDVYTENLKQDFTLFEEATAYGQDYQRILS